MMIAAFVVFCLSKAYGAFLNCSSGELELASTLTGGYAVLQRGVPASVYGCARPHESVTVRVGDDEPVTASSNAAGEWFVKIAPQPSRYNATLVVRASAENTRSASAVVSFGEVVLCSGQSNMGMSVGNNGEPHFRADNGTAECAASVAFTGRVSLLFASQRKFSHVASWATVDPKGLGKFSAVCWYSGKSLFERLGGDIPVGLMLAAVGGSPIEYWIPPRDGDPVNVNPCEQDIPQCDNKFNDSSFWNDIMTQLTPYTVGSIVWDQAERDVKCPVSLAAYPCLQEYLVSSWRKYFGSPLAPFVTVQLPGYTGALANGTGRYDGYITSEMVFTMRMAQEAGAKASANATAVATYDYSCPTSPYGSVHNVEKGPIGDRVGASLFRAITGSQDVVSGPRAVSATAVANSNAVNFKVTVRFEGGSFPFSLRGTKNCTTCCNKPANGGTTVDLDATDDATTWMNSTDVSLDAAKGEVTFMVSTPTRPTWVRHTAASIFPQCALYNAEGLPAVPFQIKVSD